MTDPTPETARGLLYRHGLPEDVIDGVLCLHGQELAAVQRREAAVWGVDTAAGRHILAAADLIDPTKTEPASPSVVSVRALHDRVAAAVDQVFEAWRQGLGGVRPQDALTAAVVGVLTVDTQTEFELRGDTEIRASTLREAGDRLWALANRTTERGAGVLWAAKWLRDRAAEIQQGPTDADVVEAHELALSFAVPAAETQQTQTETRAVPLAAICAYCGHRYDEHNRFGCHVGNQEVRCGCEAFVLGAKPEAVSPWTILGVDAAQSNEASSAPDQASRAGQNLRIDVQAVPRPARGDQFETWLKAQRDEFERDGTPWPVIDYLLDEYRLHADTGTPLSEHVCEGKAIGDCECLEANPLRAELTPVQLLASDDPGPLPDTERVAGGRRLGAAALPPVEGPEYTPCACGHIEPEHESTTSSCWTCDCEAYRPAAVPAVPVEATTDNEETAVVPCSLATLKRQHGTHRWEAQPGMDPVRCPGYAHT
ncbi:hypothetical protein [Streptomyces sp. NPDC093223]|uniref:hypothetical protein n=1 Tax=Streptomyces sp. NPDC093223 TaxID=3366033 RepID=UPI0038174F4A